VIFFWSGELTEIVELAISMEPETDVKELMKESCKSALQISYLAHIFMTVSIKTATSLSASTR